MPVGCRFGNAPLPRFGLAFFHFFSFLAECYDNSVDGREMASAFAPLFPPSAASDINDESWSSLAHALSLSASLSSLLVIVSEREPAIR